MNFYILVYLWNIWWKRKRNFLKLDWNSPLYYKERKIIFFTMGNSSHSSFTRIKIEIVLLIGCICLQHRRKDDSVFNASRKLTLRIQRWVCETRANIRSLNLKQSSHLLHNYANLLADFDCITTLRKRYFENLLVGYKGYPHNTISKIRT